MALAFGTPIDIAGRACQHMGVRRISSFADNDVAAAEIGGCYDQLRQAELQRNVWKFAVRRSVLRPISINTRLLAPKAWDNTWVYRPGSIVSYNGVYWIASWQLGNLNQVPGLGSGGFWDVYFGPLTAEAYDPTGGTAYYPGELVYVNNGAGWIDVYLNVAQGNAINPFGPDTWSSTTTYTPGDVVQYTDGYFYKSLVDFNLNNEPDLSTAPWQSNVSYASGAKVAGADGMVYQSTKNSNLGNNPVLAALPAPFTVTPWDALNIPVPWTTAFRSDTTSNSWRKVLCDLRPVIYTWPIGTGPIEQPYTKNAFRLPNGYLRRAPQDPSAGSVGFLGAPTGMMITDWTIEAPFLISREVEPIPLRFIADVTDVSKMDAMFCEGLGARVAHACVERVTQSAQKKVGIMNDYKMFMGEARQNNAIEEGSEEPPVDEWISCRI